MAKITWQQRREVERRLVADVLLTTHGAEKMGEAFDRLCHACGTHPRDVLLMDATRSWRDTPCNVFPLTLDGKDCPYYTERPKLIKAVQA